MAGNKRTRVYVTSPLGDVEDRDQWPAMIDWLLDQHARFRRASLKRAARPKGRKHGPPLPQGERRLCAESLPNRHRGGVWFAPNALFYTRHTNRVGT